MNNPSAKLLVEKPAKPLVRLKDGRVIELRPMGALERLRLFKAAGQDLSSNDAWLGMAFVACAAAAVDGIPVPFPANEAQVEALVGRLGDTALGEMATALEEETKTMGLEHMGN